MEISNNFAPTVVSAVVDAIKFNQSLLQSETLRDIEDHEEYLLSLHVLLSYLKDQYKPVEKEIGIPFSKLAPSVDD